MVISNQAKVFTFSEEEIDSFCEALCLLDMNPNLVALKNIVEKEHRQPKCRILVIVAQRKLVDPLLEWAQSELRELKPAANFGNAGIYTNRWALVTNTVREIMIWLVKV